MSQFFKTSQGVVPPGMAIVTVTGDDATVVGPDAAGNLNLLGGSSTVNNSNGIITIGNAGTNTETFTLTNRSRVTSTTSDGAGQTQTVTMFTPTAASAITFVVSITGYDVTNNLVAGGELVGIARTSGGGVVVVVGTNDTFDEADAALVATDWDIVTNGTVIQAQFVGIAGRTINWVAVLIYSQVQ